MNLLIPLLLAAASLSAGARDYPEPIPGLPTPRDVKSILAGTPNLGDEIHEMRERYETEERELLSRWEELLSAHDEVEAQRIDQQLQEVRDRVDLLREGEPLLRKRYYREPKILRIEMDRLKEENEELVRREHEVALRFAKLPVSDQSEDAQRTRAELEELRILIPRELEAEKELQEELRSSEQSPEYQFRLKIENGRRQPARNNIGGVWGSGPNLIGYTLVLEQKGKVVSGLGEFWGCSGAADVFPITGTYVDGILRLNFERTEWTPPARHAFRYAPEKGRPRFLVADTGNDPHPFPRSLTATPNGKP